MGSRMTAAGGIVSTTIYSPSISSPFSPHCRIHPMHIVVVVQRVKEVGHLLARGVAQLGEVLGQVADFGRDDRPAGALQSLGDVVELLGLSEEARAFLACGDFLGFERLDLLG